LIFRSPILRVLSVYATLSLDRLSGTASVIAVIQLADRVLTLCGKYVSAVKDAKKDIERLSTEVGSLQRVLQRVDLIIGNKTLTLHSPRPVVEELEEVIKGCQTTLLELKSRLDLGKGNKPNSRFWLRALEWPFQSKDVANIIETLDRHKSTLLLALSLDQR
jgi:hypothetical protein